MANDIKKYVGPDSLSAILNNIESTYSQKAHMHSIESIEGLQVAINTSLAQAKASGEFDGADGKDGQDGKDGAPGADGANGKDGTSATHSWNGTVLTISSASGTSSADLKGAKGDTGATGPAGANATINGVNALTIAAGDGISASQSGNALNISVVGKAPAYTYSTTDLTAGTSSLTTGQMYLVYE